jgi:probable rRNA maturation factor
VDIAIDNRCGEALPTETYVALARYVLEQEGAPTDVELSLSLVDKTEIQALNREYRDLDAPTDVLSFECDAQVLGDVVVCPEVAREHASDFNTNFTYEMTLMFTHGILHLLGYDHIADDEAEVMEARENELVKQWLAR